MSTTTTRACQCEHVDHEGNGGHPYLGVPAGDKRAEYVGPICDACATGHLSDHVIEDERARPTAGALVDVLVQVIAICEQEGAEITRCTIAPETGHVTVTIPAVKHAQVAERIGGTWEPTAYDDGCKTRDFLDGASLILWDEL